MTAGGRRAAMAAAGVAAALGVAALAWAMAEARVGQAEAYARERSAQRRAVAATRLAEPAPPAPSASPARKRTCVVGLETFAVAVERALVPLADGRTRRIAALEAISDAAIRAERGAELARPAPTLPRRMGLEGHEPVIAERRACDGTGYAELK